jgi:cytochrome c-type biogenesis protein CcmE
VPDEMQDSNQQLEDRFRLGGMAYRVLINKPMGFSQSLSRVLAGDDIIWQKPNITQLAIY